MKTILLSLNLVQLLDDAKLSDGRSDLLESLLDEDCQEKIKTLLTLNTQFETNKTQLTKYKGVVDGFTDDLKSLYNMRKE